MRGHFGASLVQKMAIQRRGAFNTAAFDVNRVIIGSRR